MMMMMMMVGNTGWRGHRKQSLFSFNGITAFCMLEHWAHLNRLQAWPPVLCTSGSITALMDAQLHTALFSQLHWENVAFHLVFWIIHLQKFIALTFNKTFMICIMQHLHLLFIFFFPAPLMSFFMIHYSKISLIHFSSALDQGIVQNLSQSNVCYPLNCNCSWNPYSC